MVEQVRNRLTGLALLAGRPVSANDFTDTETEILGNRAGQVFKTPNFRRLESSVKRTKASANGRRVFYYEYIGA